MSEDILLNKMLGKKERKPTVVYEWQVLVEHAPAPEGRFLLQSGATAFIYGTEAEARHAFQHLGGLLARRGLESLVQLRRRQVTAWELAE